jgi:hypothetical protein
MMRILHPSVFVKQFLKEKGNSKVSSLSSKTEDKFPQVNGNAKATQRTVCRWDFPA